MNDDDSVGWCIGKCVGAGVGRTSCDGIDSDIGYEVGVGVEL